MGLSQNANDGPACNGTIISDIESKGMGEVIQLQGDHRIKIRDFLVDSETGLGLDEKTIKVCLLGFWSHQRTLLIPFYRSTASKPAMSASPQLSGSESGQELRGGASPTEVDLIHI